MPADQTEAGQQEKLLSVKHKVREHPHSILKLLCIQQNKNSVPGEASSRQKESLPSKLKNVGENREQSLHDFEATGQARCCMFLDRFECEAFERAIGRERIEASTSSNVIWHSANMIAHHGLPGLLFVVLGFRILTVILAA